MKFQLEIELSEDPGTDPLEILCRLIADELLHEAEGGGSWGIGRAKVEGVGWRLAGLSQRVTPKDRRFGTDDGIAALRGDA